MVKGKSSRPKSKVTVEEACAKKGPTVEDKEKELSVEEKDDTIKKPKETTERKGKPGEKAAAKKADEREVVQTRQFANEKTGLDAKVGRTRAKRQRQDNM